MKKTEEKVQISKNYYNELIGRRPREDDESKMVEVTQKELNGLIDIYHALMHSTVYTGGSARLIDTPYGPEPYSTYYGSETVH